MKPEEKEKINTELEKISKVFNTKSIMSTADVKSVIEGVGNVMLSFKTKTDEAKEEIREALQQALQDFADKSEQLTGEVKNTSEMSKSEVTEALSKALEEVKQLAKEVMEMKPLDGLDADEDLVVEKVLGKIVLPEYKETVLDDGAKIIGKINEEKVAKIKASQISDLPKFTREVIREVGGHAGAMETPLKDATTRKLLSKDSSGAWLVEASGGSGATAFTDLTDVPSSYTGAGGKVVAVNVGETGLEFISASGTGTVTSVAATVPTGLTISGSPITAAGTLAIALDTGYVIPLQTTLDGKANTALSNLASVAINTSLISDTDNTDDLGSALIGWRTGYFSTSILTPTVTADTSAGLLLESANGTDVGLLGSGNTANVEWYGSHNFDTATQDTIAAFTGAGKTLGSLATATYPSLTELSYVKGVTSAIQTQLNAKVDDGAVTTSGLTMATSRILGRTTASTGAIEELTAGSSLSLSAGSLDTIQDIRTSASPEFTGVNVGHATDTTITRSAAGVIAVEGVVIPSISSTNTLTNKRITKRVGTTTSSATPTINTDNVDYYSLTAQTADITSFTTNLSGTPTDAQTLWISITGTAARAITWGASFESSTVTLPTTTVSTDRLDVGFVWNAATSKWRCVAKA